MAQKRVTIKDISEKLGVSYGVISKALNNKGGINKELRDEILKTADKLGYRINKVAQSMARNTIVIGVVIPSGWQEYYANLRKGIDAEFDRLLDYNVECRYYTIHNVYSGIDTIQVLDQCIADKLDGIILCDVFPVNLEKTLKKLEEEKIPIVLIGGSPSATDKYLCSIQVDGYRSGQMAAEILSFITKKDANVAIFVGNKDNIEHKMKIQGFVDSLEKFNLNSVGIYETHDDEIIAQHLIRKILGENTNLHGIYSATSNFSSIGKVIEEKNLDLKVINTDIDNTTINYMRAGIIQCAIFQDLEKHGRTAVRLLYEYIAEHKEVDKTFYITPQLVIQSNLDVYTFTK